MKTIGMYLYGWYEANKWRTHKTILTPIVGYYQSDNYSLANWQAECISRTGVDYVVFEMVGLEDPSFMSIVGYIEKIIPELRRRNIEYTFIIDFWVFDKGKNPVSEYKNIIDYLSNRNWLAGLYNNPVLDKAVFLFSPWPELMEKIGEVTPSGYCVYSALWSPTWGRINLDEWPDEISELFKRYWDGCVNTRNSLASVLENLGYFPFWQTTEGLISMNRIASVIPGYDDLLLSRQPQLAPVVPRKNGNTLVEQFSRAVKTGASNILIYGWNEYFEATTIEPTLEYGDFYVELTRRLIEQVKHGETIHMPEDVGMPKPVKPIYLTAELKRTAEGHPDKIPRWDQNDYLAKLDVPQAVKYETGKALFNRVQVTNIGQKAWCIETKHEPIRLGVRIIDELGQVVREGRAEFGRDIKVGEKIEIDLTVDMAGLPRQNYLAEVGIVWEGRFWFEPTFKGGRISLNNAFSGV